MPQNERYRGDDNQTGRRLFNHLGWCCRGCSAGITLTILVTIWELLAPNKEARRGMFIVWDMIPMLLVFTGGLAFVGTIVGAILQAIRRSKLRAMPRPAKSSC